MTLAEKVEFIEQLSATHKAGMLDKIGKVPENWDGVELREWFVDSAIMGVIIPHPQMAGRAKRRREYDNAVVTRNL